MLGTRIKIARKSLNLCEVKFAASLEPKRTEGTVLGWEADELPPTMKDLADICRLCCISMQFFVPTIAKIISVDQIYNKHLPVSSSHQARAEISAHIAIENYLSAELIATGRISDPFRVSLPKNTEISAQQVADTLRRKFVGKGQSMYSFSNTLERHGAKIFYSSLPEDITALGCIVQLDDEATHPFLITSTLASPENLRHILFDWAFNKILKRYHNSKVLSLQYQSQVRSCFFKPSDFAQVRGMPNENMPNSIYAESWVARSLINKPLHAHAEQPNAIFNIIAEGISRGRLSQARAQHLASFLKEF